jgi:hypothetical protein
VAQFTPCRRGLRVLARSSRCRSGPPGVNGRVNMAAALLDKGHVGNVGGAVAPPAGPFSTRLQGLLDRGGRQPCRFLPRFAGTRGERRARRNC